MNSRLPPIARLHDQPNFNQALEPLEPTLAVDSMVPIHLFVVTNSEGIQVNALGFDRHAAENLSQSYCVCLANRQGRHKKIIAGLIVQSNLFLEKPGHKAQVVALARGIPLLRPLITPYTHFLVKRCDHEPAGGVIGLSEFSALTGQRSRDPVIDGAVRAYCAS